MKAAVKHWYGVLRADGMDPIRAFLLALLKVSAGDKR